MILSTIRMKVSPGKRNEALRVLKMTIEYFRVQPGCLECNVYENAQESNVLMFMGMWRSNEDLMRHLRSDEYRNVLLVMEMAENAPELRFDTISSTSGIETVEEARRSN